MNHRHVFQTLLSLALASSLTTAFAQSPAPLSPEVKHTGKGPTGYEVTFRYVDPKAAKLQIKGEWYFADPTQLPLNSTAKNTIATPGLMPSGWKPGWYPIQSPNNNSPNFPITDMTKGPNGVWTYTTPLPSGWFTYQFQLNCPGDSCVRNADPQNLAWNEAGGKTIGTKQNSSMVYVPSDPAFGTIDYSWQTPSPMTHGKLANVTYPTPNANDHSGQNHIVVYTPPGYDPQRSTPYPTLYLLHGAGENEMTWSHHGVAGNILDNLINTGQIRPLIVVMPGYTAITPAAVIDDLFDAIIPYVESHYAVSKSPSERAMAGLSRGSGLTNQVLFTRTEKFAYYGSFSRGPSFTVPAAPELKPEQIAALRKVKGVYVGAGWEEFLHPYSPLMINTLTSIGAPVTPDFTHGGHEWYLWRQLLRTFLTKVAFFPAVNDAE